MRLLKSRNMAEEEITAVLNDGYALLTQLSSERSEKKAAGSWVSEEDTQRHEDGINEWRAAVRDVLLSVFPTEREWNNVYYPPRPGPNYVSQEDTRWQIIHNRLREIVNALDSILENRLDSYTDAPLQRRLYVEDIDSFSKVRDINPALVDDMLNAGYLDIAEEEVQLIFERILNETLHKEDWGGEQNDLYSSNIIVNGRRHSVAFLLKGHGLRSKLMQISDCGKNGDQIIRLAMSPADILVLQFVGNVSEAIISDLEGKIDQARAQGHERWFCIINGQDTARLKKAYQA
jgi:hypothetical protein